MNTEKKSVDLKLIPAEELKMVPSTTEELNSVQLKKSDLSIDPKIWGHSYWYVLHNSAYKLEYDHTNGLRYKDEQDKLWFELWSRYVLCHNCSKHSEEFIKANPINVKTTNFEEWAALLHNYVNIITGDINFITVESSRQYYNLVQIKQEKQAVESNGQLVSNVKSILQKLTSKIINETQVNVKEKNGFLMNRNVRPSNLLSLKTPSRVQQQQPIIQASGPLVVVQNNFINRQVGQVRQIKLVPKRPLVKQTSVTATVRPKTCGCRSNRF